MNTLPAVLKENIPDSNIVSHIFCGRTKATGLIRIVLAGYGQQELIEILKVMHYSVVVDETTDRTCTKHLVEYFIVIDISFLLQSFFPPGHYCSLLERSSTKTSGGFLFTAYSD